MASDKKKAYREYGEAKKDMQEIVTVKSNIDHLLGLTDGQKTRKWSDSDMTQQEVQCTDFGPSWLEVAGFGEGTPQQAIFEFSRQGKSQKCASVNTLALLAV